MKGVNMKRGFKLAGGQSPFQNLDFRKRAFTLAEVLITLAIIGIVAALTIPTLTQHYKKRVVETRLAKFYTTFNQAINLSQIENGSYMYWDFPGSTATKEEVEAWYKKYFAPYVKVLKYEVLPMARPIYRVVTYLPDGSAVIISSYSTWLFIPEARDLDLLSVSSDEEKGFFLDISVSGIKWFTFNFAPQNVWYYNKGLEPYSAGWDGTIDGLKDDTSLGCNKNAKNELNYETLY